MTKAQVIAFLKCPSTQIIDLAMSTANLTLNEEMVVRMHCQKGLTQEKIAEQQDVSVNAVQRWYYSGIDKLIEAWTGVWWIEKLSK